MAGSGTAGLADEALLRVRHLRQEFRVRGAHADEVVQAVSDVSFDVRAGETFGLVGESGCGKSTAVRTILQAPGPVGGEVLFDDRDLVMLDGKELAATRRRLQMVFQDPYSSLNPRWRVERLVAEPLVVHKVGDKAARGERVAELLDLVGLDAGLHGRRRPHELSGGQCQRVAIARALALDPDIVFCDEAVSALDVSVQAQILNLFAQLKDRLNVTYVFISHDLSVVQHVSDRVGVMYLGKLCEVGPAELLYHDPVHPYTAALLSAVPVPDPTVRYARDRVRLEGDLPSPVNPPSGCRFRTRCPRAEARCAEQEPEMRVFGPDHVAACHFPLRSPDAGVDTTENEPPADA